MYIRRRIGRRRSFLRKYRFSIFVLAVGLLAAFIVRQNHEPAEQAILKTPPSLPRTETERSFRPARKTRLVYPYSVISGGVLNRAELIHAVKDDKIVAEHYSNFKAGQAEIVKTEEIQFMHVSYRMHNKIFWTAKKLKIPKGETMITDGLQCARTRCGNMVSATPQEPVSEEEPPIIVFDIPVPEKPPAPEFKFEDIPPWDIHVLESYAPPTHTPPNPKKYLPPVPYYPPPSDVVVPESGTLSLLVLGLTAFIAIRFSRKNKF